jgi:hypothetical protein
MISLDHQLGPTQQLCGRACNSDVHQGFDLLWVQVTTSADCKKVLGYSLFWEGTTNAAKRIPSKLWSTYED